MGALWLLAASRAASRVAAHALLLLLAMLKLFPAFAFPALLRQRGRWALAGGVLVAAGFAVYALATRHEIQQILDVLPQAVWAHYGAGVGVDAAAERLSPHLGALAVLEIDWVHRAVEIGVLTLGLAAGVLLAFGSRRRLRPSDVSLSRRERFQVDAFVAGAGIFCGTFAAAENWDYRLAFLLLTLPQLLSWAGRRGAAPLPFAPAAVACVLATLWLSFPVPAYPSPLNDPWNTVMSYFAWEELLNWLLFTYLVAGVLVTLGAPWGFAREALGRRFQPARGVQQSLS